MKYPKGDRVFVGCTEGYLCEYSMSQKKVMHNYGKVFDGDVSSM